MANYVARKNDDGMIYLYGTTTAIGVDFCTVNVLVLNTTNVDVQKLQADLATAQANLNDLQDKVNAINTLEA